MIRKQKVKEPEKVVEVPVPPPKKEVAKLTQEFGNGDMNVLRDKINEIIASL